MTGLYASWVKGLPQSVEAMDVLRLSGIIDGIEMGNIDEQVEMIEQAGLGFSPHTPGLGLTLNLASPNTPAAFDGEQGNRLLEVIRKSTSRTVGFHLGYSASDVVKMSAFPNLPDPATLIADRDALLDVLVGAIVAIEGKINAGRPESEKTTILLETMDYSREGQLIPWDVQKDEVRARRSELQAVVDEYGINAALLHVTDPAFAAEVIYRAESAGARVGFLFDVAHMFISADSKMQLGLCPSIRAYIFRALEMLGDDTLQLHVNVPGGDAVNGFNDHHRLFGDDDLSRQLMGLTRMVYGVTRDQLRAITLEMRTDLPPVEHARQMVEQGIKLSRAML